MERNDVSRFSQSGTQSPSISSSSSTAWTRAVSMATLSATHKLLSLSTPIFSSEKLAHHAYSFSFPLRNPNPNPRLVSSNVSANRALRSMPELLNASSMADEAGCAEQRAVTVTLRDICRNHVPDHVLRR